MTVTLEQVMHQWASNNRSFIKPIMFRGNGRKWHIRLEEIFSDTAFAPLKGKHLDTQVEWTESTLKTWKTAHRTSWDTWRFDNKREAEKFVTLYNLIWA